MRKAPGPDGFMSEHLKAGGEAIAIWLTRILVVDLETIRSWESLYPSTMVEERIP